MEVPGNELFKKQFGKLVPSTFKKGVINRVYPALSSADIQIIGSQQTIVKNIPFAAHIDPTTVKIGAKCRVDQFDESNPSDMVIAYIYGTGFLLPTPKTTYLVAGGFLTVPATASYNLPHGLGVTPDAYGISPHLSTTFTATAGRTIAYIASVNAVNIVITADTGFTTDINWFAIKFLY